MHEHRCHAHLSMRTRCSGQWAALLPDKQQQAYLCTVAGGTVGAGSSGLGPGGKAAVALAVIIGIAALAIIGSVVYRRRQQSISPAEQVQTASGSSSQRIHLP